MRIKQSMLGLRLYAAGQARKELRSAGEVKKLSVPTPMLAARSTKLQWTDLLEFYLPRINLDEMTMLLPKFSASLLSLALMSVVASAGAQTSQATTIKYAGSSTVAQTVLLPKQAEFQKLSGLTMEIFSKSSGSGLQELMKGTVDVAGISGQLNSLLAAASKAVATGTTAITTPKNLTLHNIGRDKIVLVVNAKNSFNGTLSKEQLKDIFTKKTTNWKDLGGDDAKIILVVPPLGSGTYEFFRHAVMDGQAVPAGSTLDKTSELQSYSSASEVSAVAKLKYAIAAASAELSEGRESVRIIKTADFERPLSLVTVGAPSPKVQKLIDYLNSPSGKSRAK